MTLKNRANAVIATIVVIGLIVLGGLHYFSEHGQFTPASTTGGATKSEQRDRIIDSNSGQPTTGGAPTPEAPLGGTRGERRN